jgi:hypothetical protein
MKLLKIVHPGLMVIVISTVVSCKMPRMQMTVPAKFQEQADKMVINGITKNGRVKRQLSFGAYKTSKVKRGWLIKSSRADRNTNVTIEERVLRAFDIDRNSFTSNQRDKFKFSIQNGNHVAEVFAMERKVTEETRTSINSRWLSDISIGKNFQYSFSAVILPLANSAQEPWNLFIYSNHEYKPRKKPFELQLPDVQEEGILTNKKDTITIKLLSIQTFVNDKGKEVKLLFPLPTAYELRIDNGVTAIIDTWGKIVWMYNGLDEQTKLAIAAASSAIFYRRINERVGMG